MNAVLDDEAKRASSALMEPEHLFGATMRTCFGVARLPSRLNLQSVVLDFLFG
jgi:hypothetical protein